MDASRPWLRCSAPPVAPPPLVVDPPPAWKKSAPVRSAPHVVPARVAAKDITVLSLGRHVSHLTSGKTHLWREGDRTVCRSWKCGTPETAVTQAKFMRVGCFVPDRVTTPHCRSCFSQKLDFLGITPSSDTGCREAADGSEDSGGYSTPSDSSETNASYSSVSMVSDDDGIMWPRRQVDVSSDDEPLRKR